MITALKIIIAVLAVFTAIGLACAVGIARRRDPGIGRRRDTPADPFAKPFGEMPGFTAEQLRAIAPPRRHDDPLRRSFTARPLGHSDRDLIPPPPRAKAGRPR